MLRPAFSLYRVLLSDNANPRQSTLFAVAARLVPQLSRRRSSLFPAGTRGYPPLTASSAVLAVPGRGAACCARPLACIARCCPTMPTRASPRCSRSQNGLSPNCLVVGRHCSRRGAACCAPTGKNRRRCRRKDQPSSQSSHRGFSLSRCHRDGFSAMYRRAFLSSLAFRMTLS